MVEVFHSNYSSYLSVTLDSNLSGSVTSASMAPRQATSKGTAKKVAKVFASKTVKDVLEKVITTSIEQEKLNQKTVTASNAAGITTSAALNIINIIKFLLLVFFYSWRNGRPK